MLWLSGELVKNSTSGVEGLCQALLRQISGGDNSSSNVWLAENVLGLLNSNRFVVNPSLLCAKTTFNSYIILQNRAEFIA